MNNQEKANRILRALHDFMAEVTQYDVSVVGTKKALREAISEALKGTAAEKYTKRFLDDYAPWQPIRSVDEEGLRSKAGQICSEDPSLEWLFIEWRFGEDLGL